MEDKLEKSQTASDQIPDGNFPNYASDVADQDCTVFYSIKFTFSDWYIEIKYKFCSWYGKISQEISLKCNKNLPSILFKMEKEAFQEIQ